MSYTEGPKMTTDCFNFISENAVLAYIIYIIKNQYNNNKAKKKLSHSFVFFFYTGGKEFYKFPNTFSVESIKHAI